MDKDTLAWMLKQNDHELVTTLFTAGRINDLAYWRELMPYLRGHASLYAAQSEDKK